MGCMQKTLTGLYLLLFLRCLLRNLLERCWLGDVREQNGSYGSEPTFYVGLGGLKGKMTSGSRLTCKAYG